MKTIFELNDTSKVKHIFDGWNETLIYSCIQKVMGKIYVTGIDNPKSAFAYVGCFGFYAGEPEKELVINSPDGFVIMISQNESWAKLIEECFWEAEYLRLYNAGALSAEVLNDIRENGLNNKRK